MLVLRVGRMIADSQIKAWDARTHNHDYMYGAPLKHEKRLPRFAASHTSLQDESTSLAATSGLTCCISFEVIP